MIRRWRESIEGDGGGGANFDRRVAGDDETPAGSAMLGDRSFQSRLILMIERAGRFVQKPDRCRGRDQAGERYPSTLARGKPTAWPVGNLVEGKSLERRFDEARHPARPHAPERCPERQGFAWRQPQFHAVLVTDKVELRAIGSAFGSGRPGAPEKPAAGRHDQRGEDAQQAGLAAAVGPSEQQSTSGRKAKRKSGKDQALAAAARETLSNQIRSEPGFGQCVERTKKRLRWGKTGAARPRSNCSTEYEVWGTNL
jgi:hypothetical protein